MTAIVNGFRHAMEQAGLTPPDTIIADGKWHRFPTNGRREDDSGFYKLHLDGIPAGTFGDWRTGLNESWCSRTSATMTPEERAAHWNRVQHDRREREQEERVRHQEAAQQAQTIWSETRPAPDTHAYLLRKQVKAYGLHVHDGPPYPNWLVAPLSDVNGLVQSLEFISPTGEKRFLSGGRKSGHFYLIGQVKDVLCIAEGFATAASIHAATNYAVAVAFDAGNLLPVARLLRTKYPAVKIVLCGDHDKNAVGQTKARDAAQAVKAIAVIPEVEGEDWNDVHVRQGLEAVTMAMTDAISPPSVRRAIPSANAAHLHTPPPLADEVNILARFEEAVRLCGVVGEERCAKLLYLALTSRLLKEPVSMAIKGLSGSGKSFTVETVLKFFPEDAYIPMTAMSEKALIYRTDDFCHKTLVMFEAVALGEQREKTQGNMTAYLVRSLLSEGHLIYHATVLDKKHGVYETKTIRKEGPTNLILTTTATELHGENETRMLSLPTNDSPEQTKAVMMRLAEGRPRSVDVTPWHAFQRWLMTAETRVMIPYARYLAQNILPLAVRLRRDFKTLLRLIEAHAILHQVSRAKDKQGQVVASPEDYLAVRSLVADLLAHGVGATVPDTMRATVEAVRKLDDGDGATVQKVAEALAIDRSAAQRRLKAARERGYLLNIEDKRGQPARYTIGEPLPEEADLLPRTLPGCAHREAQTPSGVHNLSAPSIEPFEHGVQGVQLCKDSRERDVGDEAIPIYDEGE